MNEKVEKYIAEQKQWIAEEREKQRQAAAEAEQKQREALLDSLGIFDEEKQYTDDFFNSVSMAARMGYTVENVDGKVKFYKATRIYPKLTEEEFEALKAVQREKEALDSAERKSKPEPKHAVQPVAPVVQPPAPVKVEPVEYQIVAETGASNSFGGKVLKILSYIVWICGLIASIVLGRLPDRYGEMHFNFWLFLAIAAGFFIIGATYWAIGELFDNVASINGRIYGLQQAKIRPEKK